LPTETRAVPTDLQIQDSLGFRGQIPDALRSASQDPVSAMGLVLGLVLRRDPAMRSAQLEKARNLAGGEVAREAERFEPLLRSLSAGSRVPLLDLSMPALRQLSPEQEALFRLAITQVGYDAEDGLIVLRRTRFPVPVIWRRPAVSSFRPSSVLRANHPKPKPVPISLVRVCSVCRD
jgi:hypothetical protein